MLASGGTRSPPGLFGVSNRLANVTDMRPNAEFQALGW
jgi:hypothetical protein